MCSTACNGYIGLVSGTESSKQDGRFVELRKATKDCTFWGSVDQLIVTFHRVVGCWSAVGTKLAVQCLRWHNVQGVRYYLNCRSYHGTQAGKPVHDIFTAVTFVDCSAINTVANKCTRVCALPAPARPVYHNKCRLAKQKRLFQKSMKDSVANTKEA
jgi:hypothetical protein